MCTHEKIRIISKKKKKKDLGSKPGNGMGDALSHFYAVWILIELHIFFNANSTLLGRPTNNF